MILEGYITGIGWVTPDSMGNLAQVLKLDLNKRLPAIHRKDVLESPYKPFGRMDDFSKIGFAAIAFALYDAQIKPEGTKSNTSLIASTATGCLQTDIKYWKTVDKNAPSPAVFAYTLDSCFLGEAAICFGLAGENFIINESNTTGLTGLFFALEQLSSGQSEKVICGINNGSIRFRETNNLKIKPGALFFVVEKKSKKRLLKVIAESADTIYDRDMEKLTDLYGLAKKCCKDEQIIF